MDRESLSLLGSGGLAQLGAARTGDGHFDGLGEPMTVLPGQLIASGGLAGAPQVEGERRLLIAVLEDALHCFQKYAGAVDRRGRQRFVEAEEWFMEPDSKAKLTFEYICETGGLDADSIRANLRRWCEKRLGMGGRWAGSTRFASAEGECQAKDGSLFRRASGE